MLHLRSKNDMVIESGQHGTVDNGWVPCLGHAKPWRASQEDPTVTIPVSRSELSGDYSGGDKVERGGGRGDDN